MQILHSCLIYMQQRVDSTPILHKHIVAPTRAFWYIQILHGICKYCVSSNHHLNLVDSNHWVPDTGWCTGACR